MSLTFSQTVTRWGRASSVVGTSSASAWATVAPGMPMFTWTAPGGRAVRCSTRGQASRRGWSLPAPVVSLAPTDT